MRMWEYRLMDDRRELWLKTWFKSWHEGRMSSHHWAPTAEDFPRWAYFRPETDFFVIAYFAILVESLRTDLHIFVRELGEPSDNRTVEKLSKFSPAHKSCLRILQTNTVKTMQTNPVKVFLSPVESPQDWIDVVGELESFPVPHLHIFGLVKSVREQKYN